MGDMDRPGSYPFCPYCSTRMLPWLRLAGWWCANCQRCFTFAKIAEDRHREAMRLACYLEDEQCPL